MMCTSASAQWYRVDLKLKKKPRPAPIEIAPNHSIARLPVFKVEFFKVKIKPVAFPRSEYSYEAAEEVVMKQAEHNMRFRIYGDASYNFSDLAHLYILENRFSEAKWYLLQSTTISRQLNDDRLTVSNLIDLAVIKANIGEYVLSLQDIAEAYDIACARGFKDRLPEIEKKMACIKQNKLPPVSADLPYTQSLLNTSILK